MRAARYGAWFTYALEVLQGIELRGDPAVHAEELSVHERRHRKRLEGPDTRVIYRRRVFV